jgi:hypothetical protein
MWICSACSALSASQSELVRTPVGPSRASVAVGPLYAPVAPVHCLAWTLSRFWVTPARLVGFFQTHLQPPPDPTAARSVCRFQGRPPQAARASGLLRRRRLACYLTKSTLDGGPLPARQQDDLICSHRTRRFSVQRDDQPPDWSWAPKGKKAWTSETGLGAMVC